MKLNVGILESSLGWQTLLQQEGVPFSFLSSPDEVGLHDFSVLVINNPFSGRWKESLKEYVVRGGALLMTAENYMQYFDKIGKRRTIRYLVPERNSPFAGTGLVDICSKGMVIEGANFCTTDFGGRPILIETRGEGVILVLPFDPGEIIHDYRKAQKYFYSPGQRYPSERVSLVAKGEVRGLVHAGLELLHHHRGLPYCHLWYFPNGERNVFALRIDTDYGDEQEIESLYDFAEDYAIKMSWYVHTESHEQWLSRFARMDGHEIGVHCYEHAVLKSYEGSRADLMKARELLQRQGIFPIGFAAPFGEWCPGLGRVGEELGFLYSSEFSYDYDNMPSYPWMGERWNSVLQIPVHPICIGSFKRYNSTDADLIDYFQWVLSRKRVTNEPFFFYHHPKDGHHPVLKFLIESAKELDLSNILFRDFAEWWKERLAVTFSAVFDSNIIKLDGSASPRVFIHLTKGTQEAVVPFASEIDFTKIPWSDKEHSIPLPFDIERIRTFSPRLLLDEMRILFRRKYK